MLDRKHTGLVFGLNARIHVQIQPWNDTKTGSDEIYILVQSPQFLDTKWLYSCPPGLLRADTAVEVCQVTR